MKIQPKKRHNLQIETTLFLGGDTDTAEMAEQQKWTSKSRYGDLRYFTYDAEKQEKKQDVEKETV